MLGSRVIVFRFKVTNSRLTHRQLGLGRYVLYNDDYRPFRCQFWSVSNNVSIDVRTAIFDQQLTKRQAEVREDEMTAGFSLLRVSWF